jgi:phasin family protein
MPAPFSPEQFAGIQKAQIDGWLTFANTAFAGMERLAALNLNTARHLLEEGADSAQALLGAKSLQDFISIQGNLAQPAVDKAVLWSRSVYEISHATREELGKTLKTQFAETSQAFEDTLDALVKNTPPGADAAVSAAVGALKSAMGAAGTACATLNKTVRQASEYAEANFAAAAKPAAKGKKA